MNILVVVLCALAGLAMYLLGARADIVRHKKWNRFGTDAGSTVVGIVDSVQPGGGKNLQRATVQYTDHFATTHTTIVSLLISSVRVGNEVAMRYPNNAPRDAIIDPALQASVRQQVTMPSIATVVIGVIVSFAI
jgi:hypothetical protein